jgi:hypothetical protein
LSLYEEFLCYSHDQVCIVLQYFKHYGYDGVCYAKKTDGDTTTKYYSTTASASA